MSFSYFFTEFFINGALVFEEEDFQPMTYGYKLKPLKMRSKYSETSQSEVFVRISVLASALLRANNILLEQDLLRDSNSKNRGSKKNKPKKKNNLLEKR
ncbi:hypothetical protein RUM43_004998 [Polyplax serrata]|uniref:Uncharacterized protein n=1 Tax=Polyplax serrata TaxID=468196 RepID=A0AAN8SCE8_POLSC